MQMQRLAACQRLRCEKCQEHLNKQMVNDRHPQTLAREKSSALRHPLLGDQAPAERSRCRHHQRLAGSETIFQLHKLLRDAATVINCSAAASFLARHRCPPFRVALLDWIARCNTDRPDGASRALQRRHGANKRQRCRQSGPAITKRPQSKMTGVREQCRRVTRYDGGYRSGGIIVQHLAYSAALAKCASA